MPDNYFAFLKNEMQPELVLTSCHLSSVSFMFSRIFCSCSYWTCILAFVTACSTGMSLIDLLLSTHAHKVNIRLSSNEISKGKMHATASYLDTTHSIGVKKAREKQSLQSILHAFTHIKNILLVTQLLHAEHISNKCNSAQSALMSCTSLYPMI